MAIDSFDSARSAVARGIAADVAARDLVAHMTPEERLWCLDGDAPTLAGAEFLTTADGYHRAPFSPPRCHEWACRGSPSVTDPAAR